MTRRIEVALAATIVLLGTACSGGGASTDAVAWTDEVCGALARITDAATARPDIDPTDPAAAVRGLGDYLGSTSAALDTSIDRLREAGPSPVEGGDEYVARLTDTLTQVRSGFEEARTQLASVDTSSVVSVAAALPAAVAPLQELRDLADPAEGLRATDELRTAAEQAPRCRQLRIAS